jgi:uncharacterized protein (TIGR03435 family)
MIVEAVFWFHPVVWWIGARLVEERERACDEEVLRSGNEPQIYAEGILNVCKFYQESPLVCISGVTGSNLKRRVEAIMSNRVVHNLSFSKVLLLVAAAATALGSPIAVGVVHGMRVPGAEREVRGLQGAIERMVAPTPAMEAQSVALEGSQSSLRRGEQAVPVALLQQSTTSLAEISQRDEFEVVSVRPANSSSGAGRGASGGAMSIMPSGCGGNYPIQIDPARFAVSATTLHTLITWAYGNGPIDYHSCLRLSAQNMISGGPAWMRSDLWDIEASVPAGSLSYTSAQFKQGEVPKLRMMLRALLADRFKVVMQSGTKEVSAYELTAEKGAPRLKKPAAVGSMFENDLPGILKEIGILYVKNTAISDFMPQLEGLIDQPVLDRTGLTGTYSFWVEYTPPNYSGRIPLTGPPIFTALQEQVGLKLEPIKTNVEVWMVQRAEKAASN